MTSKNRSKHFQAWLEKSRNSDTVPEVKLFGKDMSYHWTDPPPLPPDVTPGSLYVHELLDRTAVLSHMLETVIWDHPAIAYDREWTYLAFTAKCALSELYQKVGAVHFADDPAFTDIKKKR